MSTRCCKQARPDHSPAAGGRVNSSAGTLVASRKEETLEGLKFLVLKTVDVDEAETGGYVVAADAVGAGVGEIVVATEDELAAKVVEVILADAKPSLAHEPRVLRDRFAVRVGIDESALDRRP